MTKKLPYVPELRNIEVEEFVRRLRMDTDSEKRFAFFIGAGCSVSSGIPTAGELVKDHWIPRLRDYLAPSRSDLDDWACEVIKGYDPGNPAASYGELIERLFIMSEDRKKEIKNLCARREPSFGYATLAQLVAMRDGRFNIVLTTNFDDMVEDALYLYTQVKALVIPHESLASHIRPTPTRPLVVKLHGDHRLSPRNTALETETIEKKIQRNTAMVLHDRGIIFIGYRGADVGILKMLNDLPPEALPFGAYWVHPHEPHGPIREWLSRRQGVWVCSGWFDEVMFLLWKEFSLPHPSVEPFNRIFERYSQKFMELSTLKVTIPSLTIASSNIIPKTGSFTLSLDCTNEFFFGKSLNDLIVRGNPAFEYTVSYYLEETEKRGSEWSISLPAIACTAKKYNLSAQQTSVTVSAMSLTPGTYRATCIVKMSARGGGSEGSPSHSVGFVEGPFIEIYQP